MELLLSSGVFMSETGIVGIAGECELVFQSNTNKKPPKTAVDMAQFCIDNNTACTSRKDYINTSELCISEFLCCKPLFDAENYSRCRYCGTYNKIGDKCDYCKR